jgi:tetratricopeptide (TPR) repeat protein
MKAVKLGLDDPEPIVRYTAVSVYGGVTQSDLLSDIAPLLNDPFKAVRMEAASLLAQIDRSVFNEVQLKAFNTAIREYEESINYTADFPTGRFNLGNLYSNLGQSANAISNYQEALKIDNQFYPAKVNLALFYYNNNQHEKAEELFLDLSDNHSEFNRANYYLGLLYAEQQKFESATERLQLATEEIAENGRIYYNLGLIYQYLNQFDQSESSLLNAYESDKTNFDFIFALIDLYIKTGNLRSARRYAEILKSNHPNAPQTKNIINYLDNLSLKD